MDTETDSGTRLQTEMEVLVGGGWAMIDLNIHSHQYSTLVFPGQAGIPHISGFGCVSISN